MYTRWFLHSCPGDISTGDFTRDPFLHWRYLHRGNFHADISTPIHNSPFSSGRFLNSQGKIIHFLNNRDLVKKYYHFSILNKILADFSILKVWKAFFSNLNIFKILNIKILPQFLNSQGLKSHFLRSQQIQNSQRPVFSNKVLYIC